MRAPITLSFISSFSSMKTIDTSVFPILFVLLLSLPFLNSVIGIWEFPRRDENRNFKDDLNFDINHLDRFPKEAEAYLQDNFSFRTPLLNYYQKIKYDCFGVSPHRDKLIMGKDNWYFLAGKEQSIYEGRSHFTTIELAAFLQEWKRRQHYFNQRNLPVYWMIAPLKHYVYQEELPDAILPSSKRRVDQLKTYFQDELPNLILDPLPLLQIAKKQHKLYYQLDNHWNFSAGYLVADFLLERIQQDFLSIKLPELPNCEWKDSLIQRGIHYQTTCQ